MKAFVFLSGSVLATSRIRGAVVVAGDEQEAREKLRSSVAGERREIRALLAEPVVASSANVIVLGYPDDSEEERASARLVDEQVDYLDHGARAEKLAVATFLAETFPAHAGHVTHIEPTIRFLERYLLRFAARVRREGFESGVAKTRTENGYHAGYSAALAKMKESLEHIVDGLEPDSVEPEPEPGDPE